MKQVFYFLIGFSLVAFPLRLFAANLDGTCAYNYWKSVYPGYNLTVKFFLYSEASAFSTAYNSAWASVNPGGTIVQAPIPPSCGVVSFVNREGHTNVAQNIKIITIRLNSGDTFSPVVFDSDSDGIPDDCDIYPDDPTPYKVRTYSYQTVDNLYAGTKSYQWIHTDRGDSYDLGDSVSGKTTFLTYSSPWEDPPTSCGGINKEPENTEPVAVDNPFTTDAPTGEPSETNSDPAFQPGEVANGTETGDLLMRDIKTNTGKTATNTDKMGDYMKELTKAVQGMDRNIAQLPGLITGTKTDISPGDQLIGGKLDSGFGGLGDKIDSDFGGLEDKIDSGFGGLGGKLDSGFGGLEGKLDIGFGGLGDKIGDGFGDLKDHIDTRDSDNDDQAKTDKQNFQNQDDQHVYDGTLEEGVDYEEAKPLEEESWLSDFIEDNPIKDWIDESGFSTSGGTCSLSFVHPRYGTLSFSLCRFDSEFTAAGNILIGLCGLYGLMLIIKG